MNVVGAPSEWVGLIDTLVPNIIDLVTDTWDEMPALSPNAKEDPTTDQFCRLLRQNRSGSNLPFTIHIQMVELDPAAGQDQGRMDVAFSPLVPREDIYFCLECKRLNAHDGRSTRAYAGEYVTHGLSRFVSGQYSSVVAHGGMLGYVLDGDVARAMNNVGKSIQKKHAALGMRSPGQLKPSTVRPNTATIKETLHARKGGSPPIQVQHIFVAGPKFSQKKQILGPGRKAAIKQ